MMTLFTSPGSGAAAVELALEAIGAPYRSVHASSWEPDSALDELARVNPLRQIPTLVLDDGSVMTESAAILIHLGLAHPRARLLPEEASSRAQAIRGLVFIASNCYSAISIIDYPERWCADADEETRKRIVAGTRERLHAHWTIFADQFPATPFFNGPSVAALDFLTVVVSKWAGTRSHMRATRPAFMQALERIEREPTVARVLQRHWPAH